jgi:hypothetical protein
MVSCWTAWTFTGHSIEAPLYGYMLRVTLYSERV